MNLHHRPSRIIMDHFQRLGLPRRFHIDSVELDANYLSRSREAHPDNFTASGGLERRASLALSSEINDAYSILRDSFRRADYLLQLLGGPSSSDVKEMPPEFLEEMLEKRMEIEEIKAKPESCDFDRMEREISLRTDSLLQDIGDAFSKDHPDLAYIRRKLNALKYLQGLMRDLI
jgi:molecular chaperone HscB